MRTPLKRTEHADYKYAQASGDKFSEKILAGVAAIQQRVAGQVHSGREKVSDRAWNRKWDVGYAPQSGLNADIAKSTRTTPIATFEVPPAYCVFTRGPAFEFFHDRQIALS